MKKNQKTTTFAIGLLIGFILWTVLIKFVDVQTIGPKNSAIGFATLNEFVHNLTGVNFLLYKITDWLGLVPILTALFFAVMGILQWIKRKHLLSVDHSLLALGVFYLIVISVYVFFEFIIINYRPILIDGILEASYPSSTTMLSLCLMPAAAIQLIGRIKSFILKRITIIVTAVFVLFMVICRFLSGVHWTTDIIGGILLSAGLIIIYNEICKQLH